MNEMGYIKRELVELHKSKEGNIMLRYPFVNKNGEADYMYVPIPEGYSIVPEEMAKSKMKTESEVAAEKKPTDHKSILLEVDTLIKRLIEQRVPPEEIDRQVKAKLKEEFPNAVMISSNDIKSAMQKMTMKEFAELMEAMKEFDDDDEDDCDCPNCKKRRGQ
jgi:hypothetical protein